MCGTDGVPSCPINVVPSGGKARNSWKISQIGVELCGSEVMEFFGSSFKSFLELLRLKLNLKLLLKPFPHLSFA
jgi:hypothetical protein